MKKNLVVSLIGISMIVIAIVFDVLFFPQIKYAFAEEPYTPDYSYLPSTLNIDVSPSSSNVFNNGYSFVAYGAPSVDTDYSISVLWSNSNNIDTHNLLMSMSFYNSRSGNLTCYGFKVTAYNWSESRTDVIYENYLIPVSSFESLSGNMYLISRSYDALNIEFFIDVPGASYYEFSFNDFVLNFYGGYNAGFTAGYNVGYNDAKNDFYNSRYQLGYSDGFNEGASGQYSFFALISAVVETPINAVLGVLNFNFLGINLKDFFLSIFTIALIVLILKFVLVRN